MDNSRKRWARSYYIVYIVDKNDVCREKRSKRAPRIVIHTGIRFGQQLLDPMAFSSLAHMLRHGDKLARIRWFLDETQIGATGWFPTAYDSEVVEYLAT